MLCFQNRITKSCIERQVDALYNILGVSVGAGLIRENGFLLGADGTTSTQEDRLSVIPFQASGLFVGCV